MGTTENNKLIAEFMGFEKTKSGGLFIMPEGYNWERFLDVENYILPSQFLFHSSWDWLMTVVDGILNASLPLTMDNPINQKRIEIFKNVNLYSSIDKVYNACVEFIKWYNEQK